MSLIDEEFDKKKKEKYKKMPDYSSKFSVTLETCYQNDLHSSRVQQKILRPWRKQMDNCRSIMFDLV